MSKSREVYEKIRQQVSGGALYNLATLRLAEMDLEHHRAEEAWQLLSPIKGEISLDGLALFHELSFKTDRWQEALDSGTKIYQSAPSAELAYQNAKCAEHLGLASAANGWMKAYQASTRHSVNG